MPLSDVQSSETSAQNAQGKNFQKFTCSNFHGFVFHSSYFRVLVVGHENCENLDLTKISRYTVILAYIYYHTVSIVTKLYSGFCHFAVLVIFQKTIYQMDIWRI